jgi:hypothetical protein
MWKGRDRKVGGCNGVLGKGRESEGVARSQSSPGRREPPEAVQTHHRRRIVGKGEWVEALFGLLLLEMLPCTALWIGGHLLLQLVARPEIGESGSWPSPPDCQIDTLTGQKEGREE